MSDSPYIGTDFPDLNAYQHEAKKTAIYPRAFKITYPTLGLAGETGEFANKWKKVLRDGNIDAFSQEDMISELGDVLWYLAVLADDCGITLSEIAAYNLNKLNSRKDRGVLGGSGDNR